MRGRRKKVAVMDIREAIPEKDMIAEINASKLNRKNPEVTNDSLSNETTQDQQTEEQSTEGEVKPVQAEKSTDSTPNNNPQVQVNVNVDEILQKAVEQKENTISLLSAQLQEKSASLDELKTTYEADIQKLKEELDAIRNTSASREQTLATELASKTKDLETLEGLLKLSGVKSKEMVDNVADSRDGKIGSPMFNKLGSDRPQGAVKDFMEILDDQSCTPTRVWFNPSTGERMRRRDYRYLDRFVRQNKQSIRNEFEKYGRAHGLFGASTDAAVSGTTTGDTGFVPDAFLDYLSSMMRINHAPQFIFHQFPVNMVDLAQGPGNTILVPRIAYLDEPTSVSDFELGNDTTYTAVSGSDQGLVQTSVSITLKEYGLGKGGGVATRPVAIPEFISARSMIELERGLERNLAHNYYAFEDLAIRSLFAATTVTYYNVSDQPATAPVNGGGCTLTKDFLNNLYALMYSSQILTYPNGKYVGVLNPIASAQLKTSLSSLWSPVTNEQVVALSESLMSAGAAEIDRVDGYIGSYYGFDLFTTNAYGTGSSGEGVTENDTVDGGSSDNIFFRDNYFFGPGVAGRAIGMPVEIRQDNSGTFGRNNRYIWLSHEGFGYLDCDAAINSAQQTRCIRVRTSDKAV